MADNLIYELSSEQQGTTEPFISCQHSTYVSDSNGGSYSGGSVTIDSSSLSNSGQWASYREAVLVIPLVVRMTAITAGAQIAAVRALQNSFAVGLKNGYHNLIHSLSLQYNNATTIQLTPYINHLVSYKLLSTLSEEDLKQMEQFGFTPDGWQSATAYGVAANPAGHGSINNRNARTFTPNMTSTYDDNMLYNCNEGLRARQTQTGFTPPGAGLTEATCATIGKNYFAATTSHADSKAWYVLAQIKLAHLSDFFDKMPIVRGAFLRFTFNTNTAAHRIQYTLDATAVPSRLVTDMSCTATTIQGGTSPLVVASAEGVNTAIGDRTNTELSLQGGAALTSIAVATLAAGTYEFEVACSIGKDITTGITHPTMQSCRLYVPLYKFDPARESDYLTMFPQKRVVYNDCYQYSITAALNGGAAHVTQLLSNGIPNPKRLIIIPFFDGAVHPVNTAGTHTIAPYQSPFASEPATSSPYIALSNLNVQVAGVNIWSQQGVFDFETYRNEVVKNNSLNGGLTSGLSSGLISYSSWQCHRVYEIDLSRRLAAENSIPKSIQLTCDVFSSGATSVQLMCFVEFERSVTINMETGALTA